METTRKCPECGTPLAHGFPVGDCPGCALRGALALSGGDTPTTVSSEKPGDRIGPYRLVKELGEGGCGVVYLAEQTEPLRRELALKVIKPGMGTRQVIARFENERQALALMDHPNIAKVFDAGTTQAGRPYFVMELVRGVRITDFCNQHRLSAWERLRLVMLVCEAVQHAHQKGIIHRDLKPSNILVTAAETGQPGVPKVIDFGIAKATQDPLSDRTTVTAWQQLLGTPAYMSPEQATPAGPSGQDVDTRSDVYALGVLLYELLTGHLPFDQKDSGDAGFDEIRRQVREVEPPKPSTRLARLKDSDLTKVAEQQGTEPAKLVLQLRGDLDWIVMKCLEKDRARRYDSPNSLARDLQRHLNHEPVTAAAPSVTYRMGKLIRRNRLVSALVGLVIILHVVIAWLSLYVSIQRTRSGKVQELALREAREQRTNALVAVQETLRQKTVADRALSDATNQWARAENALVVASNEWVRAEARQRESETLRLAADKARTNALLAFMEAEGQRADAERARLAASNEWARAETALRKLEDTMDFMLVELSDKLRPVGRVDLLRSVAEKVLAYYQSLPAENYSDRYHRFRASRDLGQILAIQGHQSDALQAYRASLDIAKKFSAREPENSRWQGELAVCHNRIGEALVSLGEPEQALEEFQNSLAIVQRLAAREPREIQWQQYLLASQINLGGSRWRQGDKAGALAAYQAALTAALRLAEAEPNNSKWQQDLAASYRKVGALRLKKDGPGAAREPCLNSLQITERWTTNEPNNAQWKAANALSLDTLGDVCLAQGDTLQALTNFHSARNIFEELAKSDSANAEWQQAWSGSQLKFNEALLRVSRNSKTLAVFVDAHEALFALLFKKPAEITQRIFTGDKRNAELAAAFRQNIEVAQRLTARDPQNRQWQEDLAKSRCLLGDLWLRAGAHNEALKEYQAALAIRQELADQNPRASTVQYLLALSHAKVAITFLRLSQAADGLTEARGGLRIFGALATRWPDNFALLGAAGGGDREITDSLSADERAELEAAFARGFSAAKDRVVKASANQQEQADWADYCLESGVQKFLARETPGAVAQAANAVHVWQGLIQAHPAIDSFKTRLSRSCVALGAFQILNHQPHAAVDTARRGLDADPAHLELKAILTLACLLDHQMDQARDLLAENKHKVVGPGRTFPDAILDDLRRLSQAGLASPDTVAKVAPLLAPKTSLRTSDPAP